MSDIHITINGGTNTIVPNATKVEQHFHGILQEENLQPEETSEEDSIPETERLSIYINKAELPRYLSMLSECYTATELAKVVVTMAEQEPKLTAEEIVKARFINLLLPHAPQLTKGTSIDNIRQRINDAWSRRPKSRN